MNRFWNWKKIPKNEEEDSAESRVLEINGTIAAESWFDDDVTPRMFKDELYGETGNVDVWINSPGGDCVAASQIYTMLRDYPGKVTVKIDGWAASAASVIAMAGDEILMSPTSLMMIHNPITSAEGNSEEMQKAIDMLSEVKESIINAYEIRTKLSRAKISHMMDEETWMNANRAVELGFATGILKNKKSESDLAFSFTGRADNTDLMSKVMNKVRSQMPKEEKKGRPVDELMVRLNLMKH